MYNISVILLAAGNGSRMKNKMKKQYMTINGKSMIEICIEKFNTIDTNEIILIVNATELESIQEKYKRFKSIRVVSGGNTRQQSCNIGIQEINKNCDFVLIHDVARVLVSESTINTCITLLKDGFDCCAPYLDSVNSLLISNTNKQFDYCNREKIKNIQTPQGFKKEIITKSVDYLDKYTDNIGQVIDNNKDIHLKLFEGEQINFKITTMYDFLLAEYLMANHKSSISSLSFNGKNKKALVFGGNGGIGKEIVKDLVQNNVEVHLSSREIRISDDDLSSYKNINWDIIVNCIGTMTNKDNKSIIKSFKDLSLEDFCYVVDVNFISCVKIAKLAQETMINGGHLLFIGSSSTKEGREDFSSYSSSKTAISSFVESISKEFFVNNIMVNCLHPSRTNSKMRNVFENEDIDKMLSCEDVGRIAMGFCNGNVTGNNFYLRLGDIII